MLNWNCLLAFKFFAPSVYKKLLKMSYGIIQREESHVRECCIGDHEKRKSKALCKSIDFIFYKCHISCITSWCQKIDGAGFFFLALL